jgi:predicted component of type VI protein secretion system
MQKLPKNIPNPFEFRDNLEKLKETREKGKTQEERIQAILEGEKPTDQLSWEFYIWKKYKDPLAIR